MTNIYSSYPREREERKRSFSGARSQIPRRRSCSPGVSEEGISGFEFHKDADVLAVTSNKSYFSNNSSGRSSKGKVGGPAMSTIKSGGSTESHSGSSAKLISMQQISSSFADKLRGSSISRSSSTSFSSRSSWFDHPISDTRINRSSSDQDDGMEHPRREEVSKEKTEQQNSLAREERERIRFHLVPRKKGFVHMERVEGKLANVLKGLELHTQVFNGVEQKKIVDFVYHMQELGRQKKLRERTYSEPRKWMRGKGRVTMQFGCCYNYATDKDGNPPGIIRDEEVDPIPNLLKAMIKRLVSWHVLPPTCVPDSCIVNIYDEGDCIPPHIDHHDFLRPFCTVSFLSECSILFGLNLKPDGPGEFYGPVSIPLPVGSVLVLNGNGADVAKHCVPSVPSKRISITFRKMDQSKLPYSFSPEPDLQGLKPLSYSSEKNPVVHQPIWNEPRRPTLEQTAQEPESEDGALNRSFNLSRSDFPSLGDSKQMKSSWKRSLC